MIISCVILNYNDADTTISLLEKIKEYSLLNYIVVVDNNSSDDSFETLRTLASDKIKVINTGNNGGYGSGNNYGIKYSPE